MSENRRTAEELKERDRRIVDHAKAGLNMPDICDIEGLDPNNTKRFKDMIKQNGATLQEYKSERRPTGLNEDNSPWRIQIAAHIDNLRIKHTQIELSRMIGLTNKEINDAKSGRHNFTIAQIQRVAYALNMSFKELILDGFALKEISHGVVRART